MINDENNHSEKKPRGGWRPGSGRTFTGHARFTFSLSPELMEEVKTRAKEEGKSLSAWASEAFTSARGRGSEK